MHLCDYLYQASSHINMDPSSAMLGIQFFIMDGSLFCSSNTCWERMNAKGKIQIIFTLCRIYFLFLLKRTIIDDLFTLSHTIPNFNNPEKRSLLKTLWEKEKIRKCW